ncbi:hypothetical protein CsSME_00022864 [Camellia sinensis var. sinensis]
MSKMAAVSPKPNTSSNSPIDHCFDLDLALTMADNSDHWIKVSGSLASSTPSTQKKSCLAPEMATVNNPGGVCTVCMEAFLQSAEEGTVGEQIPCGHVYHDTCIAKWLSLHDSCPLCRCKISGDR